MRPRLSWAFVGPLLLLLLFPGDWPAAAEPELDPGTAETLHRVVMHLSSGDAAVQKGVLNEIRNLYQDLGPEALQVELVVHGDGLKLLTTRHTAFASELATLKETYGVEYTACSNTMKTMGLTRADLIEQVDRTEPALARIVELGEQGWVYIKP